MSLLQKYILVICCLFLTLPAKAQDKTYYLQGSIGNYPIAMRITCYNDTDCAGSRYYYRKTMKDIVLDGEKKGNHFTIGTSKYNEDAHEMFDLQQQADQSFTGTWSSGKKKLPVKLQAINTASISNPFKSIKIEKDLLDDPYEYLRATSLGFVKDSVTKQGNKELVWFHEKASAVSFFRLGNGFSPLQLQKTNAQLDQVHLESALSQLSCSGPWGGSIDFTVHIGYLDENLLGFDIFSSWDCGGAHPDFGGKGYLLELNTGHRFDIDDILAFDASVTTEARSGFDAFSKYRGDFFAPKLLALMDKAHHFKEPKSDDDCSYTEAELWVFPAWQYSTEGISFIPGFPRVMRACEEPFLLTFEQLKAYRNPKFPYPFPAAKKK